MPCPPGYNANSKGVKQGTGVLPRRTVRTGANGGSTTRTSMKTFLGCPATTSIGTKKPRVSKK